MPSSFEPYTDPNVAPVANNPEIVIVADFWAYYERMCRTGKATPPPPTAETGGDGDGG